MKKTILLIVSAVLTTTLSAQKYVGGDLSLVPAYEAAGDVWLDADGKPINTTYSDGMLTYLRDVAKWNAVRVRLIVDANADNAATDNDGLPTCQDIEYVKKFGKRIKDAGMSFLLDIFYSDTWTDVSQQWIPVSWGYNKSTATATLAAKVKSYTTEVLNALTAAGAKPDFIQIGNEVSYGMLWDNAAGASKSNYFSTGMTYNGQKTQIERFATLLKAAAEGVRASECSTAKIVLHCERTISSSHVNNFYTWVGQAGFTDYDIIGLSYYPIWHGTLNNLQATLNMLQSSYSSKEVHIVETGYYHTNFTPGSGETDTRSTWPYSPAGQAAFLKDLIAALNGYEQVKGLYYWQPEECGNGAGTDGKNRVMGHYDNRGFWELTWKSGSHALNSKDALMAMKAFIGEGDDPSQEQDVTSKFVNMDFETAATESVPGWTINYDGWGTSGPWPKQKDQWHSSLTSGNLLQGWCEHANSLSAGNIIYQSATLPAGTYTLSAVVHTDYDGIMLFANDDTQKVTATSTWGTAYEVTVTATLASEGTLTIGLKLLSAPTITNELNLYCDNFKVLQATGIENVLRPATTIQRNAGWYTLDGRRLTEKPSKKGIYIHNNKKAVVR